MSEAPYVRYMERTRDWYRALGYQVDYRWAERHAPELTRLAQPLADTVVALVTTASLAAPEGWSEGRPSLGKRVWSIPLDRLPENLFTDDTSWAKESTHTDDRESYLPLAHLERAALENRIGSLAPRVHGLPTEYSHRATEERDAPELLLRLRRDGAQAALFVPL